jgi:hypothetical protein
VPEIPVPSSSGAKLLPELAALCDAWATLPDHIRATIRTLVAAGQTVPLRANTTGIQPAEEEKHSP